MGMPASQMAMWRAKAVGVASNSAFVSVLRPARSAVIADEADAAVVEHLEAAREARVGGDLVVMRARFADGALGSSVALLVEAELGKSKASSSGCSKPVRLWAITSGTVGGCAQPLGWGGSQTCYTRTLTETTLPLGPGGDGERRTKAYKKQRRLTNYTFHRIDPHCEAPDRQARERPEPNL